jgi:hypothetical protein
MCRNFGKQKIVGNNGMVKFFFPNGLVTILIGGFFKSCFTNPSINNFEQDGLFKYFQQRSYHICLFSKSNI